MRLALTFPSSRRSRRGRWAMMTSGRLMSVGARAERMLASRLAELERKLDHAESDTLWQEYYRCVDLWLRTRMPGSNGSPPITKAQLAERFKSNSSSGRG